MTLCLTVLDVYHLRRTSKYRIYCVGDFYNLIKQHWCQILSKACTMSKNTTIQYYLFSTSEFIILFNSVYPFNCHIPLPNPNWCSGNRRHPYNMGFIHFSNNFSSVFDQTANLLSGTIPPVLFPFQALRAELFGYKIFPLYRVIFQA